MRTQIRSLAVIADNGVWPYQGLGGPDPEASRRHQALAHVLCSMPEEDYQQLTEVINRFSWFIPDERIYGMVYPFPAALREDVEGWAPHAQVIYFNPALERAAWSIILATVSHEIAHVVLGHQLWTHTPGAYSQQEEEAWNRICTWGYAREATQHKAMWARRHAREQRLIRNLSTADEAHPSQVS
jgi:hypothetical protein